MNTKYIDELQIIPSQNHEWPVHLGHPVEKWDISILFILSYLYNLLHGKSNEEARLNINTKVCTLREKSD